MRLNGWIFKSSTITAYLTVIVITVFWLCYLLQFKLYFHVCMNGGRVNRYLFVCHGVYVCGDKWLKAGLLCYFASFVPFYALRQESFMN